MPQDQMYLPECVFEQLILWGFHLAERTYHLAALPQRTCWVSWRPRPGKQSYLTLRQEGEVAAAGCWTLRGHLLKIAGIVRSKIRRSESSAHPATPR